MVIVIEYILLIFFSYLIGNISWARIISESKNGDITKNGSGNPGTMNMLRTYGAKIGILTLVLDALKGVVPALTGMLVFRWAGLNEDIGLYVGGLSAVVGHMFPVLYKFKGGKGVATSLGVFMVANPLWLIVSFVAGFLYVWFFDYGSVASLFIVASMSIIQGWNYNETYAGDKLTLTALSLIIFAMFSLVWIAHRKNIVRLLLGKENKANLQKSFRKKLKKQKTEEVKTEYIEQKSELKIEYKKLKAEYRKDVRAKKKEFKNEYKRIKKAMKQSSVEILANEISEEKENLQNEIEDKNINKQND
ncbi:MAG: glycerol-3-phosphate acyltransferase [Clostridia bacterium]|nr:glycerol-3-phosphate acyltransferase [Clostridia bacterium]